MEKKENRYLEFLKVVIDYLNVDSKELEDLIDEYKNELDSNDIHHLKAYTNILKALNAIYDATFWLLSEKIDEEYIRNDGGLL